MFEILGRIWDYIFAKRIRVMIMILVNSVADPFYFYMDPDPRRKYQLFFFLFFQLDLFCYLRGEYLCPLNIFLNKCMYVARKGLLDPDGAGTQKPFVP